MHRTCCKCVAALPANTGRHVTVCQGCRKPRHDLAEPRAGQPLTPREEHVVRCIMKDNSCKLVAHELGLGTGTVKVYLSHIYKKLGVGRAGLVKWGMRNGFDDAPPTA